MKRIFLLGGFCLSFLCSLPVFAATTADIESGSIKKNAIETDHFQVEFSDLILHQADSDRDGLSDIVEDTLEDAEDSYDAITGDLEYPEPEGDKILLILDDTAEYLLENSIGTTGYLPSGELYIAIDPWLVPDYLKITIGHEFFHYIQFHYDPAFSYDYQGVNLGESTAVWIEDELYDDVDDYVNYLPDFFDYVDFSVFSNAIPTDTLFSYGLTIWPRFLSEYYDDPDIVREIWQQFSRLQASQDYDDAFLFDATREAIEDRGDQLPAVFQTFTEWNLALEPYSEGDSYPIVFAQDAVADGSYILSDDQYAPALYGTNYLYFPNTAGRNSFEFHLIAPEGVRFAVTLVPFGSSLDLSRAVRTILDVNESMDAPLKLKNLSATTDVVAIVSPVVDLVERPTNNQTFDEGYLYYYAAAFGESLDLKDASDLETDAGEEVKDGQTEVVPQEVRGDDQLRLAVQDFGSDYVMLSWNRLTDEDIASYEIHYGTESGHYSKTYSVDHAYTTFATVRGLDEGTTYYFQLKAIDKNGKKVGDPSPEITVIPSAPVFEDVPYSDSRSDAIDALTEIGVFQGYPDGSFRPNATINRAELLKILVEGQGVDPDANQYRSCFPDVGTEWFARYVCYAKAQGWVQGYPDNTFRPGQTVNKVEALKMMFEAYNERVEQGTSVSSLKYSDLATDAWYSIYVWKASQLNLLSEEPGTPFGAIQGRNRGDMAEELYRYLVKLGLI